MKKFLSALLLCTFLLALTTSLTGCKGVTTESKLKSMVEKALEEKYKEEFVCTRIIPGRNPGGSYTTECYPVKNSDLLFDAQFHPDNMKMGVDYYPNAIAALEFSQMFDSYIGDMLGTHFISCYHSLGTYDDDTTQAIIDGKFTLELYMSKRYSYNYPDGINHKLEEGFLICIDSSTLNASYDDEWDAIMNALECIRQRGLNNNTDLCFRIWLFFVPHDTYNTGLKYSKSNIVGISYLEDLAAGGEYKFNRIIHFDVGLDIDPITEDEYVKLRKEVD
ncbi:MAG: hypothetical protein HDT42_09000 [Ruminococcaceae bacterium]|nr:hypothetical protein [Oscillospiraceae bacterium]